MAASVSPTYPGVYVQTVIQPQPPTGGASTSVGAFIGRTPQGPVNTVTTCLNFADFQQQFGGLDAGSPVTYQASAFFNNGGNQAEIVRLYHAPYTTVTVTIVLPATPVAGEYTLTFAPLLSGPTVKVSTNTFSTTPPTSITDVYNALIVELGATNAFNGSITIPSTNAINPPPAATAALSFDLAYPCSITLGGPVASFTLTSVPYQTSGSPLTPQSSTTVTTESGVATLTFSASPVSFVVAPASASANPVVLTLTPPGGAPYVLSVPAPTGGWPNPSNAAAIALYQAIRKSSQASALVTATVNATAAAGAVNLMITTTSAAAVALTVDTANVTPSTPAPSAATSFELTAANPGAWGNNIVVLVDTTGITGAVASNYGLNQNQLFNLTVTCNGASERFTAVTLVSTAGANRLDRVLNAGSVLVTLNNNLDLLTPTATAPPAGSWAAGIGGADSGALTDADYIGDPSLKTGLYAFNQNPYGFNILSIPPDNFSQDPTNSDNNVDASVYQEAAQLCADNNAMLIMDPPTSWTTDFNTGQISNIQIANLGSFTAVQARACAVYFPRVVISDPLRNGLPRTVVPSGYVAAVWASVDMASGIWKAPAGLDAPIGGIMQLEVNMNDDQNGVLNPLGINALRLFTGAGNVVWGARTLQGADQLADQYKYIPVQRVLDYIETSLLENTRWAVFQPNGPALWSMLQNQITVFMNGLFTQGAFAGTSASQAYFVKCDATTTTPADTVAGIVNVQVGFAPIYPAEFVVITISQITASSG